jgi:hypothetical protein
MEFRLTPQAERELETNFETIREAFQLLDLIDAEFRSDPMSTQCFDLRIVQRVAACVAARKQFVKNNPIYED